MLPILRPIAFSARTADSRPGPGPLMRTSMFFTPHSCAARPQRSAATCAANGVDLREPLKPAWPEVAQASVLPWRSVMVTMVLLKDAWMCAIPSDTFFLTFLRARAEAVCWSSWRVGALRLAIAYIPLRCLAGLNIEFDGCLTRAFARPGVSAGALTPRGKSLAMARAAVAAEVDQALDRHLHLAAQVALDGELLHVLAQAVELGVGQILDLARALHAGGGADRLRARATDAEDRGQRDLGVLVIRDVDTCNACHVFVPCAEPAIIAALTRCYQPWRCLCRGSAQITRTTPLRRTILHLRQIFFTEAITFITASLCSKGDPTLGQIVRRHLHGHLVTRQDADVIHAHPPGDEGVDRVPVLQLYSEGCVRQVLHYLPLHLDHIFLRHAR